MSRTLSESPGKAVAAPAARPSAEPPRRKETNRETVESIVVAVILALLIRGFEAEAFVIPTGSMAPTLMGRHKEVPCPECGNLFAVNAHAEEDLRQPESRRKVEWGVCDNCRVPVPLKGTPSYKGDRILVMKFPYDLPFLPGSGPPDRWDVVVFKYPGNPDQTYIKRLVGLPGEEITLRGGDVLVRPAGGAGPPAIARKAPHHQQAMQVLVADDAHRPESLKDRPEWSRWATARPGDWSEPELGRFACDASAATDWAGLTYRHLVPEPDQWVALKGNRDPGPARPSLITDFYAYNTNSSNGDAIGPFAADGWPHWVGDLTLHARLEVESASPEGVVRLELVRGGIPYRCQIELKTGSARMYRGDEPLGDGPVPTIVRGPGRYDLAFANVDGRLTLWVNNALPFGDGVAYDDGTGPHAVPTAADLAPASVAAKGVKARVDRLRITRDIYYTLYPRCADYLGCPGNARYDDEDDRFFEPRAQNDPFWVREALRDPARFDALAVGRSRTFRVAPDKLMMMGDNSPESYDGRAWEADDRPWDTTGRNTWEVPRTMVVGKAFFVYWPHGVPFWPDIAVRGDLRVPFRPYVERMKWIR